MAEPKVGGAVEEMNKIAGLGLIQTNMAEDNAHPTKKPVPKVAEMIEIDSHHLISGRLGAAEEMKGESLFLQNGQFSWSLATCKKQRPSQRL